MGSDHLANGHLAKLEALEIVGVAWEEGAELRKPLVRDVELRQCAARHVLVAGEEIHERMGRFAARSKAGACQRQQTEHPSLVRREGFWSLSGVILS